jgi:hypothetical protein
VVTEIVNFEWLVIGCALNQRVCTYDSVDSVNFLHEGRGTNAIVRHYLGYETPAKR